MNNMPLPQNTSAEAEILGAILNDSRALETALALITADDFYETRHRRIFRAMEELSGKSKKVDAITVGEYIGKDLISIGGTTYLTELMGSCFTSANIKEHSLIVKDKSNKRELIEIANKIRSRAYGDVEAESLLSEAQDMLLKVSSYEASEVVGVSDISIKALENMERNYKNGGGIVGLSTGIRNLDDMLLGMKPADYIIIAGRPSMGKTALMLTLFQNVAKKETRQHLYFR